MISWIPPLSGNTRTQNIPWVLMEPTTLALVSVPKPTSSRCSRMRHAVDWTRFVISGTKPQNIRPEIAIWEGRRGELVRDDWDANAATIFPLCLVRMLSLWSNVVRWVDIISFKIFFFRMTKNNNAENSSNNNDFINNNNNKTNNSREKATTKNNKNGNSRDTPSPSGRVFSWS